MGQALQIRVIAVTWNEDLLEKLWPRLTVLAKEVPIHLEKHGVLELIRALDEGLTFMEWSEQRKQIMGPLIRRAAKLKRDLEEALAGWKAREANQLSDQIEEVLDELEHKFVAEAKVR